MAAWETVQLLVVVVLSLPAVTHSFKPLFVFDGESITHRVITQVAILRKTAEVCRDMAVAAGRDFSLTIDNSLTVEKVQQACLFNDSTTILSTINFHTAIATVYLSNAIVDLVFAMKQEHHFDDETFEGGRGIITRGVSAVKASVKLKNFAAGRWILGQMCHTLQDFYSHSNWVEMGNKDPYSALITPEQPLENMAGIDTATCENCTGDNCADNLVQQDLITSGYFNILSSAKPQGKCSHGGFPDKTSRSDPEGGINKDTIGASHGSLHHDAAKLATTATIDLLENIRLAVGNTSFLHLMGLPRVFVLCFVIDTTSSMSDDIAEAKRISFEIIDSKRGILEEPSSYILVPFNDPGFGPLTVTTDANEFKKSLNKLSASGGGDMPELCLSGLQLALTAAPPSSDIFVFTDAPAKDTALKSTITALIESKKSVVTFILTDALSSRRRHRHSQGVISRAMSQADAQLYRDLAAASGGQAIEVTKSGLTSATSVIKDSSASAVVTVFQVMVNPGKTASFTFIVDGSMGNGTAYITGNTSLTFNLTSPSGVSQNSSESDGPLGSITSVGNLRRVSLNTANQTGVWRVSVSSDKPYSIKVTGQSSVDFIYNLVEPAGGRGDFILKEGRPSSGGNVSVLVIVTGSDTVNITEVNLFGSSGPTEVNVSVQSMGGGNYLVTFSNVPAGEFVLLLKGSDISSTCRSTPSLLQRQGSTHIKTSSISITAQVNNTSVEPGTAVSIPFVVAATANGVVNESATGTFTVRANNDRSYNSTSPSSVSIEAGGGGKANGTVTITIPASAESGTDVTLTFEAENEASTDINFAVLRLSVAKKVTDITRPVCQVVSTTTICPSSSSPCASVTWEFSANVTDGINGTGVESVTLRQGHGTLNTSTAVGAGGENITVVHFSATCCSQMVELTAVDKVGNARSCVVQARQAIIVAPAALAAGNTMSTGGHTLSVSHFLWISVLLSYLWR